LSAAPEKKVINVYRDGQITYERQEISLEQLAAQLSAAREKYLGLGVVVRGDASVPFERVASVLSTCKQAGIQDLSISVELAQTAKHAVR
jgi:biopolymer transport protein ExbD